MKPRPIERLKQQIRIDEKGCWRRLKQPVPGNGYWSFCIGGRIEKAHRAAYLLLVGPIPEGHEIDHLCSTRDCVNPEHLQPVTRKQNAALAMERRTTCRRGHERTQENIYTTKTGKKQCRVCQYEASIIRMLRKRLEARKAAREPICE